MQKEIYLQNGTSVIIDEEDFVRCSKHIWWFSRSRGNHFSVGTHIKGKHISLKRFILSGINKEKDIFHKNGNTLDFRKENLGIRSRLESVRKSQGWVNSSSKYKGVCYDKSRSRWKVQISEGKKMIFQKRYKTELEAVLAYNKKITELYGEGSAYLNVIDSKRESICLPNNEKTQHRSKPSKYRGVVKKDYGYSARISINRKMIHISHHNTDDEAAKAYDKKAYELYGDKAILNFPENIEEYKVTP